MKLISMTDFVLEKESKQMPSNEKPYDFYIEVTKYAKFLKKPLMLGMFIPCDLKGLEVNKSTHSYIEIIEAKKRVLFKDFDFSEMGLYSEKTKWVNLNCFERIEGLVKYDLELNR